MIASIIATVVSLAAGGALTFLVSRHYYLKASEELLLESKRLRDLTNMVIRGLHNAGLVEYTWDEKGNPKGVMIKLSFKAEGRGTMSATPSVCPASVGPTSQQKESAMNEKDIIQKAYEDTIKRVSDTFFLAYMLAKTAQEEQEAESHFCAGITKARAARDRALAILPA